MLSFVYACCCCCCSSSRIPKDFYPAQEIGDELLHLMKPVGPPCGYFHRSAAPGAVAAAAAAGAAGAAAVAAAVGAAVAVGGAGISRQINEREPIDASDFFSFSGSESNILFYSWNYKKLDLLSSYSAFNKQLLVDNSRDVQANLFESLTACAKDIRFSLVYLPSWELPARATPTL